jgi:16S rRNA (adenine1518-N6/adenine1519-N6)-dimethyltransferase
VSEESLKQIVLRRMQQLGIEPKRSLGQNFLINPHVVSKIIAAAQPSRYNQVIEVGPGLGVLTDPLIEQNAEALRLIEYDHRIAQWWREKGLIVSEADALKYDWRSHPWPQGEGALLVSNLPYQISSRLFIELTLLPKTFDRMVLMFQKEVALRFMSQAGDRDYGILSVLSNNFWHSAKVVDVGGGSFYPRPNVASRVMIFNKKVNVHPLVDSELYLKFLKKCFENRRKKLLPKLSLEYEKANETFSILKLSSDIRPQQLPADTYPILFRSLQKYGKRVEKKR